MDLLLQLWGGGFYLLNKVFLALAEGQAAAPQRRLRIVGWVVYILGVPAWVIILVDKHDWIAAAIEAGGLPAMCFGLLHVYHGAASSWRRLDRFAAFCSYGALSLGIGYSLYDYGGLNSFSQLLEAGVMVGFLLGSYLLAKQKLSGWLLFMLMNLSMAALMALQDRPLLALQQLVSLGFVTFGFATASRAARNRGR